MPCDFKSRVGLTCQFNVQEDELYQFNGQHWCKFHAPMEATFIADETIQKLRWPGEDVDKFNQKIFSIIDWVNESEDKHETAIMCGVIFPATIIFRDKDLHNIDFSETTFHGVADFENAKIDRFIFMYVTFKSRALFRKVEFNQWVQFVHTKFEKGADFDKAIFRGSAFFLRVKSDYITFNHAKFLDKTKFALNTFANARFNSAIFKDEAKFDDTIFTDEVAFNKAIFCGDAFFKAQIHHIDESNESLRDYFPYADFTDCVFQKYVSFINRRFLDTTIFNNCTFTQAPNFHNCKLHQDTNFKQAKFLDTTSTEADRAYRTLKLAMEQTRARDEQARFYALEQQSIRNQPGTKKWVKFTSWLYEMTSDYGRSVLRPLVGLFVIFMCSWMIYYTLSGSNSALSGITFTFAFEQIIRPFSAWTIQGTKAAQEFAGDNSTGVRYVAALQSILNVGLIALFILALRWRFRRE